MDNWTAGAATEHASAILAEWMPDHDQAQCVALLGAVLAVDEPLALLEVIGGAAAEDLLARILGALERG
jgi:hypothetical protein